MQISPLHQLIQKHTVFLFDLKEPRLSICTGILVLFKNRPFVITVSHIFDDTQIDEIGIFLGINGQRDPLKKLRVWRDTTLDLAYIELDTIEYKYFLNYFIPFSPSSGKYLDTTNGNWRVALSGFPVDMASFDSRKKLVYAKPFFVTTVILHPSEWPSHIINRKTPENNFLLKYGFNSYAVDQNQNHVQPIDPKGMSGAGVWYYNEESEYFEKPVFSLMGIQHGFFRSDKLLCGSFIKPVFDQLERDY